MNTPPGLRHRWWAVGAAALSVGMVASFTTESGFFFDDLLYLRQAQRQGLSFSLLTESLNVHFSPGHRVVDWLAQGLFSFDFDVAQVVLLAMLGASVLLVHRILVELFGPGPGPLVLALLYGTSLVHVGVVSWWSAAMQSVPSVLLSLVCVLGYVRYRRTRRPALLAVSVLALSGALLFYVKPVLVPLYLVLLRVLVLDRRRPVREAAVEACREWRVWAAYAAPVGLYGIVYLVAYWTPSDLPAPGALASYLGISWARTFAPSMVGLQVAPEGDLLGGGAEVAVVQVLIALAVGASLLRSKGTWRAWAFLGATFLANALLVGLPRLEAWGEGIGSFYRYYPEPTFLAVIALGAAFLGTRHRRSGHQAAIGVVVGAALVAHGLLFWSGARDVMEASPGPEAGAYLDNVEQGLDRAGPDATVVDGTVPEYVFASWAVYGPPYSNLYSEVFPLIDSDVEFDGAGPNLLFVAADGNLRPATFVPVAGGWAPRLVDDGALAVSGGRGETSNEGLCVEAGPGVAALEWLEDPSTFGSGPWLLDVRSGSATGQATLAFVDGRTGYPKEVRLPLDLASRDGDALVDLGTDPSRIRVELAAGSALCLERLELGRLVTR